MLFGAIIPFVQQNHVLSSGMTDEKAIGQNITLYPSQLDKIERLMRIWKLRKISPTIQRIIDEAPEPQANGSQSAQPMDRAD